MTFSCGGQERFLAVHKFEPQLFIILRSNHCHIRLKIRFSCEGQDECRAKKTIFSNILSRLVRFSDLQLSTESDDAD